MTFTVEQIEKIVAWERRCHGRIETINMLLDYAELKRREAESVPVAEIISSYEFGDRGPESKVLWLLNPIPEGDYLYETSPPSQPSTGVPEEAVHEFLDALDAAQALEATKGGFSVEKVGTTAERGLAWHRVHAARSMLIAAPRSP